MRATVTRPPDVSQARGQRYCRERHPARGDTIAPVRGPRITITCDCGARAYVDHGERWTCPECGRTWDTAQIPAADYEALQRTIRRYRLLVLGPPAAIMAAALPLALLANIGYAFLGFLFVLAYMLLVLPRLKRRQSAKVLAATRRWSLHPE